MKIPTIKEFCTGDRLYVQAQQIWIILVSFVMSENREKDSRRTIRTITYGELAEKMGRKKGKLAGHTLGRQLGIVGQLCVLNGLPALNVVVVNQETRLPGGGVILSNGKTVQEEQKAVMSKNWFELRVPTTGTFRQVWENY